VLISCKSVSMNSSKARKAYLVLTCGPASLQTSLPKGKGEDGEMWSDEGDSDDGDENTTVSSSLYSITFLFVYSGCKCLKRFIASFELIMRFTNCNLIFE
jgi:hypothetical protein